MENVYGIGSLKVPFESLQSIDMFDLVLQRDDKQICYSRGPIHTADIESEINSRFFVGSPNMCVIKFLGDGLETITHLWQNDRWVTLLEYQK